MRPVLVAVAVGLACCVTAAAQAPFRLKHTNTIQLSRNASLPTGYTRFGTTQALFLASDSVHGLELWITDGTAAGTALVKDINPGVQAGPAAIAKPITVSGSIAFFTADDGASGVELWRTDGTAAGTFMVKDICSGSCSSAPQSMVVVSGVLYFDADDGVHGRELWQSDGTNAGTSLVADINPGSAGSNPSGFVSDLGSAFFSANDGTHGVELWKVTGSTATLFADLDPASGASSNPVGLTVLGPKVFFGATVGGVNGVYVTNGTTAPAVLLSGITIASPFVSIDLTHTLFAATSAATGTELYVTDGTAANTSLLADIAPGAASGVAEFGAVFSGVASKFLYFAGFDGTRTQVWRANASGAAPFFSPNGPAPADNSFGQFAVTSSGLYFASSTAGGDLWITDGTVAGTHTVSSTLFNPQNLTFAANALLFTDLATTGEPWITSNTIPTSIVADVNPDTFSDFGSSYVTAGIGVARFLASNGTDFRIFNTDGTTAGTASIENSPGPPYSPSSGLVHINGITYFAASDPTFGFELWRTDGSPAGTSIVKDINPGGSSFPRSLVAMGNTLYFVADDGVHGFELWKSDGTAAGTALVADIAPGAASSFPSAVGTDPLFTVMGNTLFFVANDGTHGNELWKSDGTAAGTALVSDTTPGATGSTYTRPAAVTLASGTVLFFGAKGNLFKTDGTTTTQLTSGLGGTATNITSFNGLAIFRGKDSAGQEVWKSDGTAAGTGRLFDINPGAGNSTPTFSSTFDSPLNAFVNFNGTLYFGANDGTDGVELYATNGTTVALVRDICPGACSSFPHNFAVAGNRLYFNAVDSTGGEELWVTDGTFAGTTQVADIEPGTGGSNPQSLTAVGNLLYFAATTLAAGPSTYVACAAPVVSFVVSGPAAVEVSGAPFSIGVSPRDGLSVKAGIVPCYTGSIQLTSNDPAAVLPSPFAHIAGEDIHSASVTLRTLGVHTITARDTVTSSIFGTISVTVGASPVTSTIVGTPSAIVANGVSTSTVTVQLKDADGTNLTTGGGTLTLATTRGSLSSITNNNDGTYQATLTSGTVSGPAVITGTLNGTAMTNSATVQFLAGPATSLDVSAPATATANSAFTITVTARDTHGNVADTYDGTVHFNVNDSPKTLPADYTFQPADNGVHTFTNGVTLHTINSRQITATDIAAPSISGIALVAVSGATATTLQSSANPVIAGTSITLTANVTTDASGGSPAGTVTFNDGATALTTVSLVSGAASFSTSALTAGTHNLTATFNPSNAFLTSTSSVVVEFVGSLPAPVIAAIYDAANNRIAISSSTVSGESEVDVSVSTDNVNWTPIGFAAPGVDVVDNAPAPGIRLYVAHFRDAANKPGLDSNVDPATTMTFDDDPLGAGVTIKLSHITQARIAVDMFRTTVGLGPASYTDASIASADPVRGIDWDETRARLDEARALVQRITPVPPYTHPSPLSGTTISTEDLTEFWNRVK